jgi:hypothetical protein
MSDQNTGSYYPVYLNTYTSALMVSHQLFVGLGDGTGHLFDVQSDSAGDLVYSRERVANVLDSPWFRGQKPVGWISAEDYGRIGEMCSSGEDPLKYDGGAGVADLSEKKVGRELAFEAVETLRRDGVLLGEEGELVSRAEIEKGVKGFAGEVVKEAVVKGVVVYRHIIYF